MRELAHVMRSVSDLAGSQEANLDSIDAGSAPSPAYSRRPVPKPPVRRPPPAESKTTASLSDLNANMNPLYSSGYSGAENPLYSGDYGSYSLPADSDSTLTPIEKVSKEVDSVRS